MDTDIEIAKKLLIKDLDIVDPKLQISSLEKLEEWLSGEIDKMIDRNFAGLMNILYRIDVNESNTKLALSEDNPARALAKLIIERELQKVETRKRYKESPE